MFLSGLKVVALLGIGVKCALARFWFGLAAALLLLYLEAAAFATVLDPKQRDLWPGFRELVALGPYLFLAIVLAVPLAAWGVGAVQRRGRDLPRLKEASELFVLIAVITAVQILLLLVW